METNAKKLEELLVAIIAEKDPNKMAELAKQLDGLLAEREEKLRDTGK